MQLIGGFTPGALLLSMRQEAMKLLQERRGLTGRLTEIDDRLEEIDKSIPILEGYQEEEL